MFVCGQEGNRDGERDGERLTARGADGMTYISLYVGAAVHCMTCSV